MNRKFILTVFIGVVLAASTALVVLAPRVTPVDPGTKVFAPASPAQPIEKQVSGKPAEKSQKEKTSGKEVVSNDNKAALIIPDNASLPISIAAADISKLAAAVPKGAKLLAAAECSPDGTKFEKPVELKFTLPQAEIPGTELELALLDKASGIFELLNQKSGVEADGYTVRFKVEHFSTYAVLKTFTSSGEPIGGGVKIPVPDAFTGAFSHAVSLTVPPGRKGMQPNLALVYRSGNANSWAGMGFELNPGYIVRSTSKGPATYNDQQDTFYYITDSGTIELVWLTDNVYQAKIEASFTKFYKQSDDSWQALGKDGSVLKFGQTADSRETGSGGSYAWYVTRALDTNSNYIDYTYIKDQGKCYLSRIDYTGNLNGTAATNVIEFSTESRNDTNSSYRSGAKIVQAKRINSITMKVSNQLVWEYQLAYEYSPDTSRSLLKSVTQKGSDGTAFPAQVFSYQGN